MSRESYNLEIISQHESFKGKSLKKYGVNGMETVGAWGNEPFEVQFRNNTWSRVQVKLSLDGTDILTGKPADSTSSGEMWLVGPYQTLTLKAWPETNKGGAQFIFTSAEKSVALNTHGDLSSRGVIAAAVFVEGYSPIRLNSQFDYYKSSTSSGGWSGISGSSSIGGAMLGGTRHINDTIVSGKVDFNYGQNSIMSNAVNASNSIPSPVSASFDSRRSKQMESAAAVGAGKHVDQKIETVAGLTTPILSSVIRVRYMWWDDLVQACREQGVQPHGSGFPADEKRLMSIGSTPRQDSWTPPPFVAPSYSRF